MERYKRERVIGKGAFGSALLVTDRHSGARYVIKQVDVSKMGQKERDDAKKEVKLLGSFKHPNIVRYRESFIDQGMLCIVMDFADGGDLHKLLAEQRGAHLPEERVLDLFVQICLALKHIHDRKVLHRDIKSQNVFLTSNRRIVKLGDFGIARVLTNTRELARTACGTPYYMSPEICDGKPYNDKSDVWSLGCLLYEMLTLRCPFDARDMRGLVIKILRGHYPPLPVGKYSRGTSELVARLLRRSPTERPSVNEILRMPIMRARIDSFLSTEVKADEFSHTVLHRNPSHNRAALPSSELAAAAANNNNNNNNNNNGGGGGGVGGGANGYGAPPGGGQAGPNGAAQGPAYGGRAAAGPPILPPPAHAAHNAANAPPDPAALRERYQAQRRERDAAVRVASAAQRKLAEEAAAAAEAERRARAAEAREAAERKSRARVEAAAAERERAERAAAHARELAERRVKQHEEAMAARAKARAEEAARLQAAREKAEARRAAAAAMFAPPPAAPAPAAAEPPQQQPPPMGPARAALAHDARRLDLERQRRELAERREALQRRREEEEARLAAERRARHTPRGAEPAAPPQGSPGAQHWQRVREFRERQAEAERNRRRGRPQSDAPGLDDGRAVDGVVVMTAAQRQAIAARAADALDAPRAPADGAAALGDAATRHAFPSPPGPGRAGARARDGADGEPPAPPAPAGGAVPSSLPPVAGLGGAPAAAAPRPAPVPVAAWLPPAAPPPPQQPAPPPPPNPLDDAAERRRIWEENQYAVQRNRQRVAHSEAGSVTPYSSEQPGAAPPLPARRPSVDHAHARAAAPPAPAPALPHAGRAAGLDGFDELTPQQLAMQRKIERQAADEARYKAEAERIRRENFEAKRAAAARLRAEHSTPTQPPPPPPPQRTPSGSAEPTVQRRPSDGGGGGGNAAAAAALAIANAGNARSTPQRQPSSGSAAVDLAELDARAAEALTRLQRMHDAIDSAERASGVPEVQRRGSAPAAPPYHAVAGAAAGAAPPPPALPEPVSDRIASREAQLQRVAVQRRWRGGAGGGAAEEDGGGAEGAGGAGSRERARWQPDDPVQIAEQLRGASGAPAPRSQPEPAAAAAPPPARQLALPAAAAAELFAATKGFSEPPCTPRDAASFSAVQPAHADADGGGAARDDDDRSSQGSGGDDPEAEAPSLRAIREEQQYAEMLETMLNLSAELEDSEEAEAGAAAEEAADSQPAGGLGGAGAPRGARRGRDGEEAAAAEVRAAMRQDGQAEVARMRAALVQQLGEDRFGAAYSRLLAVAEEDDDEALARDVQHILGAEHMAVLGDVLHLIDCEEQLQERGAIWH